MNELDKNYSPNEIEEKWYKIWEDSKYFAASLSSEKENYSIVFLGTEDSTKTAFIFVLTKKSESFFISAALASDIIFPPFSKPLFLP